MQTDISQKSWDWKPPNEIGSVQNKLGDSRAGMADHPESTVQDRVKRLRESVGMVSQQAMANYIGVSFNRWNNVERGLPLGHDLAVILCQRVPGLTLDWLYFGKPDGLPLDLARRLGEVPSAAELLRNRTRSPP